MTLSYSCSFDHLPPNFTETVDQIYLSSRTLQLSLDLISTQFEVAQSISKFQQPYQHRSLLGKDQIRILKVFPQNSHKNIRCELLEMPLETAKTIPYEAMSYTWGTAGNTHAINLEGHRFAVTKIVHDILSDHVSTRECRYVWVDSLCINQADMVEKRAQIMMMGDIYKRAQQVVVYLGMDPEYRLAISLLEELRMCDMTDTQILATYDLKFGSLRWMSLMKLFSHPWFERCWIIQEVVMASKIVVKYGSTITDWGTLTQAVRLINSSKAATQTAGSKLPHIEMLARSREERERGIHHSFQDVMYRYSTFKATDPRDKVYAVLGCVSKISLGYHLSDNPTLILPNYNKTVQQVYIDAAKYIIFSGNPYQLLTYAGTGWNRKIHNLPSWVPDWTSIGQSTLGGSDCGFNASGSSRFCVGEGEIPESISIKLLLTDSIKSLTSDECNSDKIEDTQLKNAITCVTSAGRHGIVPPSSRPRDRIAIVAGLKTPYVVRLRNTSEEGYLKDGVSYFVESYELVGECYVDGMMDGEAFKEEGLKDCTII